MLLLVVGRLAGADAALSLRATITSLPAGSSAVASAKAESLTITLSRWSTDAERVPLVAALSAPAPKPAPTPPAAPGAAGRAGARGRGRGEPPPPPTPFARLSAAIKAAPTLGYIWTEGVTGYSIKYAWRSAAAEDPARIVLITDRRLNSHAPHWTPTPAAAADADFTIIEMRLDAHGAGEGKMSLTTPIAIDSAANTFALEGYATAPTLLKVTR